MHGLHTVLIYFKQLQSVVDSPATPQKANIHRTCICMQLQSNATINPASSHLTVASAPILLGEEATWLTFLEIGHTTKASFLTATDKHHRGL